MTSQGRGARVCLAIVIVTLAVNVATRLPAASDRLLAVSASLTLLSLLLLLWAGSTGATAPAPAAAPAAAGRPSCHLECGRGRSEFRPVTARAQARQSNSCS